MIDDFSKRGIGKPGAPPTPKNARLMPPSAGLKRAVLTKQLSIPEGFEEVK